MRAPRLVKTESPDDLEKGPPTRTLYLDIKVDQATAHLDKRIGDEQLSFIRSSLREQLPNDPMLVELVQSGAIRLE